MTAEIHNFADAEHQSRPPEFSDETLALDFAARHEPELKYVATWGRWMQ